MVFLLPFQFLYIFTVLTFVFLYVKFSFVLRLLRCGGKTTP